MSKSSDVCFFVFAVSTDAAENDIVPDNLMGAAMICTAIDIFLISKRDINNPAAFQTDHMIMRLNFGIITFRQFAEGDFLNQAFFCQDIEIAVYSSKADARNFVLYNGIYNVRSGMAVQTAYRIQD